MKSARRASRSCAGNPLRSAVPRIESPRALLPVTFPVWPPIFVRTGRTSLRLAWRRTVRIRFLSLFCETDTIEDGRKRPIIIAKGRLRSDAQKINQALRTQRGDDPIRFLASQR